MQVINTFFGGEIETLENSKHVGNPHSVSLNKNFASFLQTETHFFVLESYLVPASQTETHFFVFDLILDRTVDSAALLNFLTGFLDLH